MEGKRLLTVTFIVAAVSFGAAEECIKQSECVCKTPEGTVVDLNPISDSSQSPRFTVKNTQGQVFYFNPCKRLTQAACSMRYGADISLCQETPGPPASYFDAGDLGTQTFSGDLAIRNLSLVYSSTKSPDGLRTSYIALVCSGDTRLEFVSEHPPKTYYFNLYQPYTCPKEESGLSTGSILVIIFFVFFVVYWVGGFIYMKFVRRAEGLEMIPNYEFWKELPLLIRDGVMFTMRGCKGESTYEKI